MSTSYTITANGIDVATRSGKPAALKLANDEFESRGSQAYVMVTTEAGKVVLELTPAGRFGLWQRVNVPVVGMPASIGGDSVLAYVRKRINTGVYRFADKSYVVKDFRNGKSYPAKSTNEAREITNKLMAERKERLAAAAAAE